MMRRAVLAYQPGSVQQQRHVQARHADIVNQLVVGALEEGGIHRKIRLHATSRQPSRQRHRMLLGNAYIHDAPGIALRKVAQPRTGGHGGCDGHNFIVRLRHFAQRFRHHAAIGRQRAFFSRRAGFHIERRRAVENFRAFLRCAVTVTLFRQHMYHHRLVQALHGFQRVFQRLQVMAVNRPIVVEAKAVEEAFPVFPTEDGFDRILAPGKHALNWLADQWQPRQTLLDNALGACPAAGHAQLGQVLRQSPDVGGNGHFIIIEDNNQRCMAVAGIVERLIAHAACQGAIAHQCQHMMLFALHVSGARQPQRRRERRGRMTRLKHVILAFAAFGKARQAAEGTQRAKRAVTPRQQLMHITLMSHIKHNLILRHVENAVDCHRQLHHAQIARQMAAPSGDGRYQLRADLRRQIVHFFIGQSLDVLR